MLCRLDAESLVALDYFTVAIRNYLDPGNTAAIPGPLSILAAFLDRLRRYEPAATIAGYRTAIGRHIPVFRVKRR